MFRALLFQVLDDREEQDETLRVEVNKTRNLGEPVEDDSVVEGGKPLEACPATTDLLRKHSDGCMDFYKLETQSSLPESLSISGEQHEKLSRNLSPLTVISMDQTERRTMRIRRAHSTASFERYKQVQINLVRNTAAQQAESKSGTNTPQRRPSGPQTPSRSRHASGLQTPISSCLYDTSSISSMGEEGEDNNQVQSLLLEKFNMPTISFS